MKLVEVVGELYVGRIIPKDQSNQAQFKQDIEDLNTAAANGEWENDFRCSLCPLKLEHPEAPKRLFFLRGSDVDGQQTIEMTCGAMVAEKRLIIAQLANCLPVYPMPR